MFMLLPLKAQCITLGSPYFIYSWFVYL